MKFTCKSDTQTQTIFSEGAGPLLHIDSTADDVTSGESWTVVLPHPIALELLPVVSMVTKGPVLPASQSIEKTLVGTEAH